jgi:hypothetical protein
VKWECSGDLPGRVVGEADSIEGIIGNSSARAAGVDFCWRVRDGVRPFVAPAIHSREECE